MPRVARSARALAILTVAIVTACGQGGEPASALAPPSPIAVSAQAAAHATAFPAATATASASAAPASGPALQSMRPTASPSPTPIRSPFAARRAATTPAQVVRDLAFVRPASCAASCVPRLDAFVPAGSGPFPVVVLVRGGPSGPGGRAYLEPFARALSARGVLVFNADMRDVAAQGGGFPAAFEDVACAIEFARSRAADLGGNGDDVTLVGHSLGGYVGSVVALDADDFRGDCTGIGSGRPDAFVGLAGNYRLDAPEVAGDLAAFFGGSSATTSAARAASNPFAFLGVRPIPVRLVAGTADITVAPSASASFYEALRHAGWDVRLQTVPGADHGAIVDVTRNAPFSVATVLDAVRLARTQALEP